MVRVLDANALAFVDAFGSIILTTALGDHCILRVAKVRLPILLHVHRSSLWGSREGCMECSFVGRASWRNHGGRSEDTKLKFFDSSSATKHILDSLAA